MTTWNEDIPADCPDSEEFLLISDGEFLLIDDTEKLIITSNLWKEDFEE